MDRERSGQMDYDLLFREGDRGRKGRTLFKHTTITFSLIYLAFLLPDRIPLPYYGVIILLIGVYAFSVLILFGEKRSQRVPFFLILYINLFPFLSLILLHYADRGRNVLFYNEIALSLIIIASSQFLGDRKLLMKIFSLVISLWVIYLILGTLRQPRLPGGRVDHIIRIIFLIIAYAFSFFLSQYNLINREREMRGQRKRDTVLELLGGGEGKIGLFLLDPGKHVFMANGTFHRMTGGGEGKTATGLGEILPPGSDREAILRGEVTPFPLDFPVEGEEGKWLRLDGVLMDEEQGRPVILGTLTDISLLKESETRARNDAASIKALLMSGDIHLWKMILPERKILYLPESRPPSEGPRTFGRFHETVHPDFRGITEAAYASVEAGDAVRLEVDYLCSPERTDRYIWHRDVGYVSARDVGGLPSELSGFTMDIDSDRREASRIDQALRASGFVPWQWNKEEGVTSFDESYISLLPSSRGKIRVSQGEFFQEMIHRDDRERVGLFFREILPGAGGGQKIGKTLVFRFRFHRGDEYIWAEGRLTGVQHDRKGHPLVISGIVRDITAEKKRDLKLEEERKEREVSEMKNRFFTTVSHELLTPMNAFAGLAEQCGHTDLNREQRDLLSKMKNSHDLLLYRIHELLDISTLGRGGLSLSRIGFSPGDLLREVGRNLSDTAQSQGVELIVATDDSLPPVILGDRERVDQIIVNLVKNGIKFTPRGKVVVSGESAAASENGCRLRFTVRDEGIGIPREKLTSIFEPFGQVDASPSRRREGIGLSLAINKQLVELMGGSMEVTSTPGEGSTFSVELPFDLPGEESPPTRRVCTYPGARILVIDDNPLNRDIAGDILRLKEIGVSTAAGGLEGLQMIAENRPHLVFMDIQMPEMDGYRTTRLIREREERGEHLPVIALTANITERDRELAYAAGMDGFLMKPVDIKRIDGVLERWLEEFCVRGEEGPLPEAGDSPAIPGISMEETLERLGGEYEMLLSLLADYREDYLGFPAQVKKLWKRGDHREIYSRIHALKGVSGSLGIREVYGQTEAMGASYRERGLFRLEELEALEEKMDRFQSEFALFTKT